MPNIIFKVNNYENFDAIENLINYIMTSSYIERCGWSGCFVQERGDIAEGVSNSFWAVKNAFYNTAGQLVQHIIIGFDDMEYITESEACRIAYAVSCFYFHQGYQIFWGTHFGSDNTESYRHIHFALNTINAATGERFFAVRNPESLKEYLSSNFPQMKWKWRIKGSFFQPRY